VGEVFQATVDTREDVGSMAAWGRGWVIGLVGRMSCETFAGRRRRREGLDVATSPAQERRVKRRRSVGRRADGRVKASEPGVEGVRGGTVRCGADTDAVKVGR
jgi:hypothetical protein